MYNAPSTLSSLDAEKGEFCDRSTDAMASMNFVVDDVACAGPQGSLADMMR